MNDIPNNDKAEGIIITGSFTGSLIANEKQAVMNNQSVKYNAVFMLFDSCYALTLFNALAIDRACCNVYAITSWFRR